MWKKRFDYPVLGKLNQFQFDPHLLFNDFEEMSANTKFNGLMAEYNGLCSTHNKLPDFFLKENQAPDENASYSQLALSAWDSDYSLEMRPERSGTLWDTTFPKKNKLADERFYRKPVEGIPPYLSLVLDTFRPYLHRARFAKLNAKSQVLPHIDYDTTYGIRLHVAIMTNADCVNGGLQEDGTPLEGHIPADGSIWFVNQGVKHWAKNNGDSDRVHLIMSLDTQKFIEQFIC